MSKWEEQKFGDLYLIPSRNGLTRPSSVRGAGYKFINMGEIFAYNRIGNIETELVQLNEKEKEEMTLQKNDLLFARQSLVFTGAGKCSIMLDLEDVVSFESHIIRVRLNPEIANPVFFYYYFSLPYNSVKTIVQQCAQAGIRGSDLEKIKVPCPHIEIQNQIADVLSAYDDLIDANNRRIELLEQTAQELYKEWFVRFRFPGYENVQFEDGIPEGWSYVRFGKAIDIIDGDRGVNYPKQEEFYPEGDCLFLNAGNVTSKGFNFSACSYITKEKDSILRKGKLQHGDVVLTTRGTVGNVAFYNETMTFSEMRINSGMVILRNLGVVSPEYIYTSLHHEYLQKLMTMYASGSAQPQLPIKDMKRMKIIKPDAKTMERFTEMSADIYNQISLLIMKNQTLAKQRDMLLPRLMNGKLEV
ncbi:Type I restriction enzyme EcoKI specificity protein [uncultured Eubacterium sp.]|uniref:restriction endonuclease subunit S n=1 Tax=Brotomerdimonas butyrica TaxID=2981721 RepID=UPI0008233EA4|nr:restriction endonuclease subunit S [Brotomerdimonas butyrica]MCU6755309.1 restriction endonuclease subunit S [Brotomerdimonas butyrica]SCH22294.1 Type I restriction enzyme EcoKI specificity protein [uncultured Eubacterium sp.]